MSRATSRFVALPLLLLAMPLQAQTRTQSDAEYLQERAHGLSGRIATAVRRHHVSRRKGAELQLSVRKVQVEAGHLQAVDGTVGRAEADRMNQSLTDVERTLTHQR